MSLGKFRQLFTKHRKASDNMCKDFFFELKIYFIGWISGLNVGTFDQLRDLMIGDHIKKRIHQNLKTFLD